MRTNLLYLLLCMLAGFLVGVMFSVSGIAGEGGGVRHGLLAGLVVLAFGRKK